MNRFQQLPAAPKSIPSERIFVVTEPRFVTELLL